MATNYLKWIKTLFIALLVFCIPFFGFTEYSFADTSNITNYRVDESLGTAGPYEKAIFVSLPDGSEVTWNIRTDFGSNFTSDYFQIFYRPDEKETYLGNLTLDMDSIVSANPFIQLLLPVADIDQSGNLYYTNTFEWVSMLVGYDYYNPDDLSDTDDYKLFNNVNPYAFSGAGTRTIENRTGNPSTSFVGFYFGFSRYTAPNGLIFTNSYADIYDDNPYYFMCYIFQTLKYMKENRISVSYGISKIYADGFAHLDTEEYKLYKETLENAINGGLTDTNNKLDDLLNNGSGEFEGTKDQMQDASDKAEQGNQDIQDNAPKPDINDTVNDTSDVIDDALSGASFDKISDLLSAIFANTLISTILLISVAVGAVKYIFFGKG